MNIKLINKIHKVSYLYNNCSEISFIKEYSKSIEEYLKEGMKKYENIEVVVLNRPKEQK